MKEKLFSKRLLGLLALALVTSFAFGQSIIYTESFEDTLGFTHTPNFQTDGYGDYFLWGQDGDFGMVNLDGEDGTYYIGAEDTDADGMPGECVVTLDPVSVVGFSDVRASILLAAPQTAKYDAADYLIFEYEMNNSGTFEVLGAFYGYDWANGDGTNGQMYEDVNLDGAADSLGTELTSTFQEFSFQIDSAATTVTMRVRLLMNSGSEEIAFDKIQIYEYAPPSVTLNVDMSYQASVGNFNPASDFVDVAGSMNGWGNPGTAMTDADGDSIWSVTLTNVTVGDVMEYKFRINGTNWESVGNRSLTVGSGANVATHWFDNTSTAYPVLFTVEDGTQAYQNIEMKGSFDGWVLHPMYDDGTNGDLTANDHIWSLEIPVPGNTWEWGAIENDGSAGGLWLIDGGNPQFTLDPSGVVTGTTDYVIPAAGNEDVVFNVNMNQQIALGNFNVTNDFVDLAGNFNGFGGSAAMDDTDGDGIYSITVGGFNVNDVAEFKFRINGTGWESIASNRFYTVIGGGVDNPTYWFNDVEPAPAPGLFFSEYIEGSSNNKALEIYNGTGATVNLEGFSILTNYNGNAWNGMYSFPAGATLAAGDVWVLANNQSDPLILAEADDSLAYNEQGYVCGYNGDDVRALVKITPIDTFFMDYIGRYDLVDPGDGWDVAGISNGTQDHTLVRKASVTVGNLDWDLAAGTDSLSSEWIVFPQNTYDYLGMHPHSFIETADLVVNVNMSYQMSMGNFTVADTIYAMGDFNLWAGTEMTDTDGDSIYAATFPGLVVGDLLEYKFRINAGNWESITNNRQYTMVSGQNEVTHWFNNVSPPYDVLFTVIDGTQSYVDVNLKGEYDGWIWHQMYDDGTNGDVTAGDNTWSLLLNVQGGTWQWGAVEDNGTPDGLWLLVGDNPVFTLDANGMVSGQTSYEIPAPGSDSVLFNVNMNYQIAFNNFDPAVDFVDVAGSFNGWGGSAPMEDVDGDGIYSLYVDGFTAGDVPEFKFRINGTDWESVGNRSYTVVGGGVDVVDVWFNDMVLVANELFFSEYIEGASYNKALEIYNNTGATVSLDDYRIAQAVNGGGWAFYHTFPAGATLADGDVWVLVANAIDPNIYDTLNADEVLSYPSATHHNGDDARAIVKISGTDTIFVDVFGDPNSDPGTGWEVAGVASATANHTLIRKTTVITGNTDWQTAFGTSATNSEWKVLPINTVDYLGTHPHVFDSIADVTFNVNMSHQQTLGIFDPAVDFVDVAGDMNGFGGGDLLTDPDGDMIYSITFDSIAVGTTWAFKFRINGSWDDTTCEFPYGGSNRSYTVQDGINDVDYWYNDAQPAPVVSIYDIQYTTDSIGDSPYVGSLVETSGLVTAVAYNGYFLQDGTGMWSGIWVYDTNNTPAVGDLVTVIATVDEYWNLTELKDLLSFTILSSGNSLPPVTVASTHDLYTEEGYEGVLVKAVGATCIVPDAGYGQWYIDDGSGQAMVDDVMYTFMPDSASIYDVTGPVTYSYSEFKILPRDSNDVVDVTNAVDMQTLNLVAGWSIISIYIDPTEPALDSVFAPVINDVTIVKDGFGVVFWPAFNLNLIGDFTTGYGYQINMVATQTVNVYGTALVPENTPLTFPAGWSIIGYLRNSAANMETIFSPIVSEIIIIKNGTGQVYWPIWGLNAIGDMIPGQGYQAKMNSAQTFSYPANGTLAPTSKQTILQPVNYKHNINTGSNMTLGIPANAWNNRPAMGSEVAVYNQAGVLCGSSVYSNSNMAITIWGDDELTANPEAMLSGNEFKVVLWDALTKQESNLTIEAYESGNGLFAKDAIAVVASIDNESAMLQNFPNPATSYTEIEFSVSEDGFVNLSIYNSIGELVQVVANETMTKGDHKVFVDTENLTSGVYFYSLTTTSTTTTKSMQVVR